MPICPVLALISASNRLQNGVTAYLYRVLKHSVVGAESVFLFVFLLYSASGFRFAYEVLEDATQHFGLYSSKLRQERTCGIGSTLGAPVELANQIDIIVL